MKSDLNNRNNAVLQTALILTILAVTAVSGPVGCAYFNLLYNARNNYSKAETIKSNKDGSLSRQQMNLYDEVIKKCETLVTNYPKSKWVDDAILLMGKSFYMQGNYGEAAVKFSELQKLFPDSKLNRDAQILLARSYIGDEKREPAMAILKNYLSKYPKSNRLDEALFLLGTNKLKAGEQEESVAILDQLAKKYPKSVFRVEADMEMAEIYREKGEHERSLSLYEKLVKRKLNNDTRAKCLSNLAGLYVELGRYDEALRTIAELDKYNMEERSQGEKMLLKGKTYMNMDSIPQALDTYKSVIARFPRSAFSAESHYHMGVINQEKRDSLKIALKHFDRVPKAFPQSPFAKQSIKRSTNISNLMKYSKSLGTKNEQQKAHAQFMLAEIQLLQFNNPRRAIEEYKKVLDQFGGSDLAPKAAYSIGYIYSDVLDDSLSANAAYEYVMMHFPDSQQAEFAKRYLLKKGLISEASDSLP